MYNHLKTLSFPLFALVVSGCLFQSDKPSVRGTIVDNEILAGKLLLADGKPAVNARVRLIPVGYVPNSPGSIDSMPAGLFYTHTDSTGTYRLSIKADGEYNILGDLDGRISYLDSVFLDDSTRGIPADTLGIPGGIRGFIGLQPNHDTRTATVQILGTQRFSNVDAGGGFKFDALAEGRYSARILTTLPDYTPLFVSFQVRAGIAGSLNDTLRLTYTGIPVVEGLHVSYDTLRSIARIAWRPIDYRFLESYVVYRNVEPFLSEPGTLIGRVADTVFSDTLGMPAGYTSPLLVKYRVATVNKSGRSGDFFGSAPLYAAPLSTIRPAVTYQILRSVWNPAQRTDSVVLVASITAGNRRLTQLAWDVENGRVHPVPHPLVGGPAFTDSLRFAWPEIGPYWVYTRITDEAGTVWMDSLRAPGNFPPILEGTPGLAAKASVGYRFAPSVSDPDGDRFSFRVENRPTWASFDTVTGALTGAPTNKDSGWARNILIIVSDGRRMDSIPRFDIRVSINPWIKRKTKEGTLSSVNPFAMVALGGRIFTFHQYVDTYDTLTDAWSTRNPIPQGLMIVGAHAWDGKILVFTSNRDSAYQVAPYLYDPATGEWSRRAKAFSARHGFASIQFGDKFYLVGSSDPESSARPPVEVYDPATDTWVRKTETGRLSSPNGLAVGDSVLVMTTSMYIYRPPSDSWSSGAWPFTANGKPYTAQGRVFTLLFGYGNNAFWEFLPLKNQFASRPSGEWSKQACAESGGKLFCLGLSGYNYFGLEEFDPSYAP